jgi:hypothetical protein
MPLPRTSLRAERPSTLHCNMSLRELQTHHSEHVLQCQHRAERVLSAAGRAITTTRGDIRQELRGQRDRYRHSGAPSLLWALRKQRLRDDRVERSDRCNSSWDTGREQQMGTHESAMLRQEGWPAGRDRGLRKKHGGIQKASTR